MFYLIKQIITIRQVRYFYPHVIDDETEVQDKLCVPDHMLVHGDAKS